MSNYRKKLKNVTKSWQSDISRLLSDPKQALLVDSLLEHSTKRHTDLHRSGNSSFHRSLQRRQRLNSRAFQHASPLLDVSSFPNLQDVSCLNQSHGISPSSFWK